tara:strand:+ start:16772 stop:18010 length:1239 start_codon:yes stop_codon:yes gene_type:complete
MEKLKDYSLLLTVFFVYAILFTFDISGVRVSFYQIFQLIFISLSLLAFLKNNKQIVSDNIVHKEYLLIFLIFIFLIKIISGFFTIVYSLGAQPFNQYFKSVIIESIDLLFYYFFVNRIFLSNIQFKNKLFYTFSFSIILGSFYHIIQSITYYFYQIDINDFIQNLPFMFQSSSLEYAFGPLLRVGGFMGGPNIHATVVCSLLPFLLYTDMFKYKKYFVLILFLSLLLTLSRTGFVAFSLIIILGIINKKFSIRSILYSILFGFLLIYFLYYSYNDVFNLLVSRFNLEGAINSRYEPFLNSFSLFIQHPLGVGINNFSEMYLFKYGLEGFNPHNDWLTILLELGFLGFSVYIAYFFYILSIAKKYSNQLSFALIVLVLSQCLAGFFNQTIVLIQSNLVMILIFTLLISANKND